MAPFQKVTLLLLVASCGAEALCTTTCGLQYDGALDGGTVPPGWTCESIQNQEDRTMASFKHITAPDAGDFQNACKYLNGYHLYLRPADPRELDAGYYGYWSDYDSGWVGGETACWYSWIYVVEYPIPQGSALSHEIAHVVQNCNPLFHEGWLDAGIYQAIDEANAP